MADDHDAEERALFEVFGGLRTRLVHALGGLEDRVRQRIDEDEDRRGPGFSDVVLAGLAEFLNLFARLGGHNDE